MRFKFCWNCDCPDWILAEIVAMSKMSTNDFQALLNIAVKSILGEDTVADDIAKLAIETTGQDYAGILAAIRWILESAASSFTPHSVLSSELLQLGLRKDHTSIFVDHYQENVDELQEKLKNQSLKVSKELKFDYQVKDIHIGERIEPVAEIKLLGDIYEQGTRPTTHKELMFNITKDQVNALFYEMSEAESIMEELTK